MRKKLPNQISTKDLLDSLEEKSLESSIQEEQEIIHDNILEFLSFYNIKQGEEPVKRRVLYKMFRAWTKSKDYGVSYFSLQLNQYFFSDLRHVYIDINALDLTKKAKEVFFNLKNSTGVTSKYKDKLTKIQIEDFLKKFRIVHGEYSAQGTMLYYIYEEWAMKTNRKIINIIDFTHYLKLFLEHYVGYDTGGLYFYIDKQQMKVSGAAIEKAKKWAEARSKANKKKKESIIQKREN